jgi:hypothetical protein
MDGHPWIADILDEHKQLAILVDNAYEMLVIITPFDYVDDTAYGQMHARRFDVTVPSIDCRGRLQKSIPLPEHGSAPCFGFVRLL